jgi:hypothetical protein
VPAYWRGSAHAVPGRARDALSIVVTVQWPHARRWGGAAGPGAPADKVSRERQREHYGGSGNVPDEVAAMRGHPKGGSTQAPTTLGKRGNGETWLNLRGERVCGPAH